MERTEKSIEINAPVGVVFDLYSDFERFPEWMKHIKEVRRTGENYTRWTADAPLGINVEWEAETTALEPNRRIAWQTVRGDVEMEGEVTFEETTPDTTRMHVALSYRPPAGHLGALVAKLFGNDPEKEIDEELRRFAELAENAAGKKSRKAA
ncbi:MAG TPA: SRPBCC family protein [Pyrinomonadaceae bacterium]